METKIYTFLFVPFLVHNNFPQPFKSTIGWVSEKDEEVELFCLRILHFPLLNYIPFLSKLYFYEVWFYSGIWILLFL
jgi:hypothetical protein